MNNKLSDIRDSLSEVLDNVTGKLIPVTISNILNYMVLENENSVGFGTYSLSLLLQSVASGDSIHLSNFVEYKEDSYYSQQIIILKIRTLKERQKGLQYEVLDYAKLQKLVPTFSFYDIDKNLYLGYILNEIVTSQDLINHIIENLLMAFNIYNVDREFAFLETLSNLPNIGGLPIIQNLFVSNNVYLPVKGDVSYGE